MTPCGITFIGIIAAPFAALFIWLIAPIFGKAKPCPVCGSEKVVTGYDLGMSPWDGVCNPICECPNRCKL
jgi:hypothetical protein